ncbi:MAG TPA: hypothetical protein VK797_17680 [Tepidisphaeraceae bacterium]|nr:hypothetical protein [Tepidisphaeraceae bacterium]
MNPTPDSETQKRVSDFTTRELNRLLAEADADIEHGDLIDGETVFEEIRQSSKSHRK